MLALFDAPKTARHMVIAVVWMSVGRLLGLAFLGPSQYNCVGGVVTFPVGEVIMKRLWGIRHVRWLWLAHALDWHVRRCQELGLGICASQSDLDYLERVWSGTE